MMKKAWAVAGAAAAMALCAPAAEEAASFQQQIDELSAKVAQLEKDNSAKGWSIQQLQTQAKENPVPQWAKDIKIAGDFRARYENIDDEGGTSADRDRQRVRLRIGAYGKVNSFTDFGVRLASGDKKDPTSTNQDIGDGFSKKTVWLDQMYVDVQPELFNGAHVILGKMPQPWIGRTGLIWDSDVNPEGIAVVFEHPFTNSNWKVSANAGTFVVEVADLGKGSDARLWAGQLAAETKIRDAKVQVGVSDFYFYKEETSGLTVGNNTAGGDFHLIEGFGSVSFKIGSLPFAVNGQYAVNADASDSNQDAAYLAGITVGKAKDNGSWELNYNWRDVQRDAVVDAFNDSDFAGGTTGHHGHSLGAKYQIAKNLQAGATCLLAVNNAGNDFKTLQLDLNFKF